MSSMEQQDNSEEAPRDEEGLLLEYDVIICGTGLVQSIVASALARAGKSVLHVDGAGHYGEMDAVWPLDYIQEELLLLNKASQKHQQSTQGEGKSSLPSAPSSTTQQQKNNNIDLSPLGAQQSLHIQSCQTTIPSKISVGAAVQTPYGKGVVREITSERVAVSLTDWKLANDSHPTAHFGICQLTIQEDTLEVYLFEKHKIQSLEKLESEAILKQSRYLALDATPQFILAAGRAVQGMLASGVAEYLEFKTLEGLYWFEDNKVSRVPCSKGDVFSTKLLAPMDKRRLMKFLQLSLDYATSMSVQEEAAKVIEAEALDTPEEVQSLNERHLKQGRSLARPQNKAVSTKELEELQQYMNEDSMTFETYLKSVHKLSAKLVSIVRFALAMDTSEESTSIRDGMNSLRQHLQALGRYGNTPFLIPMYGSGELSQAFCRSAAVFGATYLLRRGAKQVIISEDNTATGILLGGLGSSEGYCPPGSEKEKEIKCSHVVMPAEAMAQPCLNRKRIFRRISLLRGKLMPSDNKEQRHVIIFPPNYIGNSHAIHGVALDDSVQVAPPGCTVLHLTTTVSVSGGPGTDVEATILSKAYESLISGQDPGSVSEIFHFSFSHEIVGNVDGGVSDFNGLHLCHHNGQALAADAAFEQAEHIFSEICPGMDFLGLSTDLETLIKERAGDRNEEDDERYMLDSAVGMIGNSNEPVTTTASNVKESQS
jgi:Rab proteins geranylgeranyltransferase component A